MNKQLLSVLIVFLSILAIHTKAQTPVNYKFSQDSLQGFDEKTNIEIAYSKHLIDQEYKYYMYRAKRDFVNHKFHLVHEDNIIWKTLQTATVQPACSNVDFEDGTFNGWTVSHGGNTNSLTMGGCCPTPGAGVATVINSVGNDPLYSPLSLVSPFGGNNIVKLNDETAGNKSQRISQTFNVTSSNAIFQIAYCGLLNSGGHDCFEQPYINISIKDSTGTVLSCPKIEIQAPDPNCTPTSSAVTLGWNYTGFSNPTSDPTAKVYWHDWEIKTVDLSPYIGSNITVQITVGDCKYSLHYGYAYFDCQCLPLEFNSNGINYAAATASTVNVSSCGSASVSIIAPTGLGPYLWNGPSGSGVSGVTSQSLSTSSPGTYTLVMSPPGGCNGGSVTKYVNIHITSSPTVTSVSAAATCTNATGSGTVNIAGGTSPYTYNWLPAASTASIGTGLSPGTDYTVNVVDTFGCKGATLISIPSFTNAPTYTINPLNAYLTCFSPSLTVTATTGTNTTAQWTHTNTANFDVNIPGSFSCVVTNTVSTCTATVPVTITNNTVAPVASPSLSCIGSIVNLNASSTSGVALGWLAPTSPANPVSNPGSSTATGIFTLTATNLSTGCKKTYTVESLVPNINVTTNTNNYILTCASKTIQATASSSTPSTTITWNYGVSSTTVNPLPISANGTYTTIASFVSGCSTQSIITITTNTAVGVNISSASTIIPCLTNSLTLTANPTTGGSYTYNWVPSSPTATNSIYSVIDAGTYTVNVLNTANGCTATATQAVTHETVVASFNANPYQGLMPLPVSFTNTSTNATDYMWDLGNGMTYTTTNAATVYNTQGNYPVVLTATKGFCVDTAVRIIKVDLVSFITVPNVFTPNGDGKNDVFTFDAINMGEIIFTVFDRWGIKVYESTTTGNVKWDGKNKGGSMVNEGTYFYIIKANGLDDVKHDSQGTINVF